MKFLVACFMVLQLLMVSEIQSFDFVVEEDPERFYFQKLAELFDLETRGFISSLQLRRGRSQRSTSNSENEEESILGDDKIVLHSYKIQSTITSRMANTMVQTKVENRAKHSQNLAFDVQIPKGAFIHNFTMNVNGITFTSSIKEKSAARSQYAQARAKGKAAAILRSNAFDMENFKAELSVPGGTKVQFEIHYQESIRRKLSSYEHLIPVQPGRLAKHLEVNIHIVEPQGISFVNVPNALGEQFIDATIVNKGEKKMLLVELEHRLRVSFDF